MKIILKSEGIQSIQIDTLPSTSPLGKDYVSSLNIDLDSYYWIKDLRTAPRLGLDKLFVNGVEAIPGNEFPHCYFIPKTVITEEAIIEATFVPSYEVEGEDGERYYFRKGESAFLTLRHEKGQKIESVDIFDTYSNEKVDVENLKVTPCNQWNEVWVSFIMPARDLIAKPTFAEDEAVGQLTVDATGVGKLLYGHKPFHAFGVESIVSDAIYSDDYDFGGQDYEFCLKPHFKKGTPLRVELVLTKPVNVVAILGNKEYKLTKRCSQTVTETRPGPNGDRSVKREIYIHHFRGLTFKGTSTLSFKIVEE